MRSLVVIGLGYVGLPLVRAAARAGFKVVGLDSSAQVVERLNAGLSHVDDISDADARELISLGFLATSDTSVIRTADTVVICVPTPLGESGGPDLGAVEAAGRAIAEHLMPGTLVVLESTTWPGTTEEYLRPILESGGLSAGVDFHLAFSPERIDPGNSVYGLENTPKVVGGITRVCGDLAEEFYGCFVREVVRARGAREAEMAKLLENTYRQVNIALVNEIAKFAKELQIDIWDVIRCAATKPFGFQAFYPGPGVGGHCIPIDPSYLSHRVQAQLGYPFRFVELAQEVNRSMPLYVARRASDMLNDRSLAVRGARILLLGITYKPGIADQRESPAIPLAEELTRMGAVLSFYDPFVELWDLPGGRIERVNDLDAALADAELVIHLQAHPSMTDAIARSASVFVLDTRGVLKGAGVSSL